MNVAILGTGLLGHGFAANLIDKGHAVTVWNRTRAKAEPLAALGATVADSPVAAVAGAERVHIILSADDAVDEVIAAARAALAADVAIFDHSTNLPARVRARYAALRADGVRYCHAPVFMGPPNARDATGLMLLAAPNDEARAAAPWLAEMTGKLWHVGERPDLAAINKLLGNAMLVALTGAFGDLFAMGEAEGLGADDVLALFDNFRPGNMLPAFGTRVAARGNNAVSWELTMARKDVRLMIETAGGPDGLVVLPALASAMDDALADGHGAKDYAIYAWPRGRKPAT